MTAHRVRRRNATLFALAALAPIALALGGCGGNRSRDLTPTNVAGPAQPKCPVDGRGRGVAGSVERPPPTEGCWNAANLASMVADPRDLIRGRPLGPAVGAREAVSVETYRKGPASGSTGPAAGTTSTPAGSTTSGPE